jgi:hypothetical protein
MGIRAGEGGMSAIDFIVRLVGFVVTAVAGIGLMGCIVYFAVSEYFRFAVNRIGGFVVLKQYMIDRPKYREWLSRNERQDRGTP